MHLALWLTKLLTYLSAMELLLGFPTATITTGGRFVACSEAAWQLAAEATTIGRTLAALADIAKPVPPMNRIETKIASHTLRMV